MTFGLLNNIMVPDLICEKQVFHFKFTITIHTFGYVKAIDLKFVQLREPTLCKVNLYLISSPSFVKVDACTWKTLCKSDLIKLTDLEV